MAIPPLLAVRNLSCCRGEALLFEGLDFSLEEGEGLQVEGANGSGKTSLLRILAGFVQPDEGDVFWRGVEINRQRSAFSAQLGYLGHHLGLKQDLSVTENLNMALALRQVTPEPSALMKVLDRLGLSDKRELLVRYLSQGQRQRVALAGLLLSGARLWILDEPFTALDAEGIREIQGVVREHLGLGGMAILTSHQALSLSRPLLTLRLG